MFDTPTSERVEKFSSDAINKKIEEETIINVEKYIGADDVLIDSRLMELDKEWNTERVIELEAPLVIGTGTLLTYFFGRKFLPIPVVSASMLLLHGLKGFYPLLPLFRRLGIRTQSEILREKDSLRVLKGDHLRMRGGIQ